MIGKYLDLCTSHLTMETVDKLTMGDVPYITTYPYEEGMFIVVPAFENEPDNIERPDDLEFVLQHARFNGCSIIRLDRDAEELDGLRTYQW